MSEIEKIEAIAKYILAGYYGSTQNCGTEPPFTGKYYKHNEKGVYCCVCCDTMLFNSNEKYNLILWFSAWQKHTRKSCINLF